tara:strand:+ start:535 stop:726 length:192 start_codon:yes stop_codon:yes gene_type:complete
MITIEANSGRKNTAPDDKAKGRARNRPSDKRKIVVEKSLFKVVFDAIARRVPDGPSASTEAAI